MKYPEHLDVRRIELALQSFAILLPLQLRLQPIEAQHYGGHQEEDAGHEGDKNLLIKTLTTRITQVEKDNACDRVDASEEQCKAARVKVHSSFYVHT